MNEAIVEHNSKQGDICWFCGTAVKELSDMVFESKGFQVAVIKSIQ
jgi:hypothetical protein